METVNFALFRNKEITEGCESPIIRCFSENIKPCFRGRKSFTILSLGIEPWPDPIKLFQCRLRNAKILSNFFSLTWSHDILRPFELVYISVAKPRYAKISFEIRIQDMYRPSSMGWRKNSHWEKASCTVTKKIVERSIWFTLGRTKRFFAQIALKL